MSVSAEHLIWIDLEMTGLNPDSDRIIEIATVITNRQLEIVAEGPVLAITQSDELLAGMDEWNTKQHTRSGLIERVKSSGVSEQEAEARTLEFIKQWVPEKGSPMCGNSICQDRRFLHRTMSELEQYFHYRNLDVSTVKELAKYWHPTIVPGFKKRAAHLAMEDIKESIEELQYYQKHFFQLECENDDK